MKIKDRIQNISEYFKQMQVTTVSGTQVVYVIVEFPRGWIIDDEIEEKFDISILKGNTPNEYFFCADIDVGEEVLFDAIDYNISKMKDAIERAKLLQIKTKELSDMFKDESISIQQLRTLKFVFDESELTGEIVIPTKKEDNKEEKARQLAQENSQELYHRMLTLRLQQHCRFSATFSMVSQAAMLLNQESQRLTNMATRFLLQSTTSQQQKLCSLRTQA